ncbi:MAG: VOC family protein [Planctomycetota bacterium]
MSSGYFVWHELFTTDVAAAIAFYGEVFGWKTQAFSGASEPYTMFCVGEQPIGGVMLLPELAKANGAPPHWLGHVEVQDLAATLAKVADLGGQVLHQETVPTVGKIAITRDPQGAALSCFQPEQSMPLTHPTAGRVSWNELNTRDWEAAFAYYSALFGWTEHARFEMGPELGAYFLYQVPGAPFPLGGMSGSAKVHGFPPHWLYYVEVEDMDAAVGRVRASGGKVLLEMDVPGGKIASCQDPQGVAFAMHQQVGERG